MSHALTLATMCTRPGCGRFGACTDDTGRRVCARCALADERAPLAGVSTLAAGAA